MNVNIRMRLFTNTTENESANVLAPNEHVENDLIDFVEEEDENFNNIDLEDVWDEEWVWMERNLLEQSMSVTPQIFNEEPTFEEAKQIKKNSKDKSRRKKKNGKNSKQRYTFL